MRSKKKAILFLRLLVLAPVFFSVLILFHWSRKADPRFYLFLNSTPGYLITRILGWPSARTGPVYEEKSESEMSPIELQVKREIEKEMALAAPNNRLVLNSGKELIGRVLSEKDGYIEFEESYGDSGALSMKIRRSRIKNLERLELSSPNITYRDILFKIEFPEMRLYKRPPYTIVTDEKYFRVEGTVRALQRMHDQFYKTFEDLIAMQLTDENIQVLFYSNEEKFRIYQKRYAPRMDTSAGFYSPWADRFIVFNQKNSQQVIDYQKNLNSRANRYKANNEIYGGHGRIERWRREAGKQMVNMAEEQTLQTVRHEGAHQLFFTYGIHSSHRIENEWLYEGLAVYCETEMLGARQENRLNILKSQTESAIHISLKELVNHRSSRGFFDFGSSMRIDLAYSESWSLVHFLMQAKYRDRFYSYIRYIRELDHFKDVISENRYQLLCSQLGVSEELLNEEWLQYIRRF